MNKQIFLHANLETPCYVYDQQVIRTVLERIQAFSRQSGCHALYSIKAANMVSLLEFIRPFVDGFACSSLYELRVAQEVASVGQTLHIAAPAYHPADIEDIVNIASHVSINSLSQFQQVPPTSYTSIGLRINPQLSFVKDERYDPCRQFSKLGVTGSQLNDVDVAALFKPGVVEGIHVHNNCESTDFGEWQQSINRILEILKEQPVKLKWFNLGGGYFFDSEADMAPLSDAIQAIHDLYGCDVFLEPGKGVVGGAGYLVASVIDIIRSDDRSVAILDTTVNHLPEVFEYQYSPKIMGDLGSGEYLYRLAGCSCLSGDLFGDYYFADKLSVGDRVVFTNIGAYMQVKAHWFNGVRLPATYLLDGKQQFELIGKPGYEDFRRRL